MKKQFVTYEIALKLRVLGFNEECIAAYRDKVFKCPITGSDVFTNTYYADEDHIFFTVPLWQQAIDWLREEHDIIVNSVIEYQDIYHWVVAWSINEFEVETEDIEAETWSIARELAILYGISKIENK